MIANNRAGHRRPAPWTDHPRTWYTLERWRRLRRHQLNKQPVCERCLERGLVRVATVADHIEDHRNWNEFLTGKLRSLCRECHEIRHGRLLVTTEIGEDGWPKQSGGGPPTIDDVSASGLRARREAVVVVYSYHSPRAFEIAKEFRSFILNRVRARPYRQPCGPDHAGGGRPPKRLRRSACSLA